jgi:DNA-binding cell septation regulator SpoVG
MDKVYTKEEMTDRIEYLVDCGFDRDVAIKIAMFKGSDGITFAIPSKR